MSDATPSPLTGTMVRPRRRMSSRMSGLTRGDPLFLMHHARLITRHEHTAATGPQSSLPFRTTDKSQPLTRANALSKQASMDNPGSLDPQQVQQVIQGYMLVASMKNNADAGCLKRGILTRIQKLRFMSKSNQTRQNNANVERSERFKIIWRGYRERQKCS